MIDRLRSLINVSYNMTMKTPIQNNLRTLRVSAGLSQKEVATGLGLNCADRISEWECGVRYPNVKNLYKLARFFGVSVDELYSVA
jgi:transcriptional regulator with XRE-family HTH domain